MVAGVLVVLGDMACCDIACGSLSSFFLYSHANFLILRSSFEKKRSLKKMWVGDSQKRANKVQDLPNNRDCL